MRHWKRQLTALLSGAVIMLPSCAMDVRDAIVGGAYDFLAGTTTELLATLFPLFAAE